jgi:hypothetical protein
MANPDTKNGSSYIFSIVIGILMFIIVFFIISTMDVNQLSMKIVAIFLFSAIAYGISLLCNYLSQIYSCHEVDTTLALKGAIPSGVSVFIGSIISSISMCRIPIASLFAPLYMGSNEEPVQTNPTEGTVKVCHITNLTLEYAESKYKAMIGISWGFYTAIAMVVGMSIGGGISKNC